LTTVSKTLCSIAIYILWLRLILQQACNVIVYTFFSLKPMIIQIIGHFLTSVKFCKILRQYQNSAAISKFRGSAQNSATHGKL